MYRSDAFTLPKNFRFFMAGHDGFPQDPPNKFNFVRLRDATTHEVLQTWYPPRNDVAHPFELVSSASRRRDVYVEIADGDTANAFAWLAAGRFSVEGLNPSDRVDNTRKAVTLIRDVRLETLRPVLTELLRRNVDDAVLSEDVASAIAAFHNSSRYGALAACMGVVGQSAEQRSTLLKALLEESSDSEKLIVDTMKVATAEEQVRIAEVLVTDAEGASTLVNLIEKGHASARLLLRPVVVDSIRAFLTEDLVNRVEAIVAELPDQNTAAAELIALKIQQFRETPGDAATGAALFKKNCSVCHQVAGQGKKVGPNLDGIGNRGVERLVEDIVAPNRNVDIAFRATTIVTTQGKVHNGLSKGTDGARLVLVNTKGEEISVANNEIEEQIVSRRSPMPDNFGTALKPEEFRNLVSWLLSLRK